MEVALQYFLQFSIAISLFYGLYLLILKNETFYNANRFYLVSGLLLAIFLPLFPIAYTTPISIVNNADFFSLSENQLSDNATIANVAATRNSWTYTDLLITIYVSGTMLFLARLLWQTTKVFQKIKKSNYKIIEGIKVIDQPEIMPYSFFNVVFIDIQKYSKRELSNILAHEKVHIQERHWIDLLIIELLSVLFWINPVVWLYERSIKENHEYLADQGVLLAGFHPGQYQALLINQLMGVKVLGFAHNLNFSLNKKRMKMMKKEKSPWASKMKLLLALPIIALLVFAFSKEEYVYETEQNDELASYERYGEIKVLKEPIRLAGEVMTIEGEAIQGAQFNNNQHLFKLKSDANGQFDFEIPKGFKFRETIIDDGNHYKKGLKILVNKEGYEPSKMLIDPDKARGKSEIKMLAHINVTGKIIDKHNQPIEGATVMDKKTRIATTSDSKGEFEIASTQYHMLEVKKEGYRTVNYALIDYENNSCNIVMEKGDDPMIKIRGKVLNSEGIPLTGANVILKGTNNGTVVDREGEFVLDVPKSDKSFKRSTNEGEVMVDNAQALVVSFVGYGTHEYVFDTQSDQEPIEVKIKLHKATFNITLPEIGDDEELIRGAIVEVPSPEFDDREESRQGEIVELPPPPKGNKKKEIFTIVEEMPNYKNGGMYQLAADIKELTTSISKNTSDRGEVLVGFTVAADGSIVNPQVVESSKSKMLDGSAIKIIQKLDNWSPGIQRGKKVPVDLTVPVKFE
jgi:TonB family protein